MTTYVFPGQGSQSLGMGAELFSEFPDLVEKANAILGYSITDLCLKDPDNCLHQTQFTQPALFVVNALSYLKKLSETAVKPDFVAGHSLGEYNALFAAQVFDFETGLKLVQKRGDLMSQAEEGGMAAVVGLKADVLLSVLQENNLPNLSIANYNSYTQIVITGAKNEIHRAEAIFENAGAMMYIPLKVSGAFHSPLMHEAEVQFEEFLHSFNFNSPKITVIANVTANPYTKEVIAEYLAKQITHSVLWSQSIDYLLAAEETEFVELGPGKVLTGIIKKIQQGR